MVDCFILKMLQMHEENGRRSYVQYLHNPKRYARMSCYKIMDEAAKMRRKGGKYDSCWIYWRKSYFEMLNPYNLKCINSSTRTKSQHSNHLLVVLNKHWMSFMSSIWDDIRRIFTTKMCFSWIIALIFLSFGSDKHVDSGWWNDCCSISFTLVFLCECEYERVCGYHAANLFDIHFFNFFKSQRKWNFQRILCLFSPTKSRNRQPEVKCFFWKKMFHDVFSYYTRKKNVLQHEKPSMALHLSMVILLQPK